MYKLTKYLTISCAHHLLDSYSLTTKKCLKNHGHSYKIKVEIQKDNLINGMIIDFGKIKEIVDRLDHQNLNDFIENPTAENMAEYLYYEIKTELLKDNTPFTLEVDVWETPTSKITYNEKTIL